MLEEVMREIREDVKKDMVVAREGVRLYRERQAAKAAAQAASESKE